MTIATEWERLAAAERQRHRRHWGRTPALDSEKPEKPYKPTVTVGTYNPKRLAEIKKMVRNGARNVDIANHLKISESSVRYWLQKYNIR